MLKKEKRRKFIPKKLLFWIVGYHSACGKVAISSIYIYISLLPQGNVTSPFPLNTCIFSCVYIRTEELLSRKKGGTRGQVWLSDLRFTVSPWCGDSYACKSLSTKKWIYSLCSVLCGGKRELSKNRCGHSLTYPMKTSNCHGNWRILWGAQTDL